MSTPAAKRRRADAANAVLRKPFHSPVIRRPDDADLEEKGASKTPNSKSPADADVYSPSSPSIPGRPPQPQAQNLRPARSLNALRQCQTPNRPFFRAPLNVKTPVQHGAAKRKRSSVETPAADDDHKGEDDDKPGSSLLVLVRAHRHAAQDATLRELEEKLETARQARRIEGNSAAHPPDAPVDQELRELVCRWRSAARTAAEELYEVVRERVDK